MRYAPDYKASARAKLLEISAALAKKNGFGTTGVDTLMAAAGLTSGAFYSHFKSKSELLTSLIAAEMQKTVAALDCPDVPSMMKAMRVYLSMEHMASPEAGCVIPSLGAEISRAGESSRKSFEQGIKQLETKVQEKMAADGDAWAAISMAVGAIVIARGMVDPKMQQDVLASAASHIEVLLRRV